MRPRSMTGFGRGEAVLDERSWTVEIRTVNHRFLDQKVVIPRAFTGLEERIKKTVAAHQDRGRVDILLTLHGKSSGGPLLTVDMELARQYHACLRELADEFGLGPRIQLTELLQQREIISMQEQSPDLDKEWPLVEQAVISALDECAAMREQEGLSLKKDLGERLDTFAAIVADIEKNIPEVVKLRQQELEKRVNKLLDGMEKFVESYNKLVQGFAESTRFDKTSKTVGLFQGNSAIRAAATALKDALILTAAKSGKTIGSFGLELQRDGTIKLDKSKLEDMLKENTQQVEDFFRGTNGRDGAFNRLESAIFDIKTSSNGIMKSLAKNLDDDATRLQEQQKASQKRLDDRYSIMARKFAAYDAVIGRLNSQGDALAAMIDAELAQKK
ncbi:MAG: hypothetical protein DSY50_02810 [Desulfobulbus sp.]|nr:MAG: hypothetical protein DSY50_02810 [Desulfobulbus sp.]